MSERIPIRRWRRVHDDIFATCPSCNREARVMIAVREDGHIALRCSGCDFDGAAVLLGWPEQNRCLKSRAVNDSDAGASDAV